MARHRLPGHMIVADTLLALVLLTWPLAWFIWGPLAARRQESSARHRLCLTNTARLEHDLMPPPYDHEDCRRCAADRLYADRPQPVGDPGDEHEIRAWGVGVIRVPSKAVAEVQTALRAQDKQRLIVAAQDWEFIPAPQARPEQIER